MENLELETVKLRWMSGGETHLDGGAMFGVVPKPLWTRKYAVNDKNQIKLRTDPILIQAEGKNFLVESGMGNGKLNEKQKRNYGVMEESNLNAELDLLGLTVADIDYVLMTHMHFDHACGLTKEVNGELESVFVNAKIITSQIEWDEMRNPNIRSRSTYWKENWLGIEQQVETFEKEWSFGPLKMIHTGGHSDGHSILIVEDGDATVVHMADIMPTHAHQNPLWVMAYDDYPMDSIYAKQKWLEFGISRNAWFTFYHDSVYRAVQFDEDGKIRDSISREE